MNFYDIVYKLAREQRISIENLSIKLGKAPSYIVSSKSRGSLPRIDSAAMILEGLGYVLCAIPNEDKQEDTLTIDF